MQNYYIYRENALSLQNQMKIQILCYQSCIFTIYELRNMFRTILIQGKMFSAKHIVHNIFIRNTFNILIVYYIIRIYNLAKKVEMNQMLYAGEVY